MPKWFKRVFSRQSLAELLSEQLHDAERMHALHFAAAEHHAALAGMYRGRAARIRAEQTQGRELRAVK